MSIRELEDRLDTIRRNNRQIKYEGSKQYKNYREAIINIGGLRSRF